MKEKSLGFELMTLAHLMKREVDSQALSVTHQMLTANTGRILTFLCHNKDRDVFQRDIEEKFMIRPSTVSANLKLMEQKGLIERKYADSDGRLKKIVLTPFGESHHEAMERALYNTEAKMKKALTPQELEEFLLIISKLKNAF